MRLIPFLAGITCFMMSQLSFANPVGEHAAYKLDKNRARTSTLIKAGSFDASVTSHNPDGADGPAYNVLFNYDLDVMFYGRQQGSGNIELAEEIFTPEFMERLRNQGEMMTDQFKIKHLGIENVSTRDGLSVSEADIVEIYDIQLGQSGAFIGMVKSMLKAMATPLIQNDFDKGLEDFQNIKIKGALKLGAVPVLGVVKADLSGTYTGIFIKAGFDYVSPSVQD